MEIKSIVIETKEWFDRTYGNSYFSSDVIVNGKLAIELLFQYGYGSHSEDVARKEIVKKYNLPCESGYSFREYCEDKGIVYVYTKHENCRKKDLKQEETLRESVKVIFRKFKKDGDIIALFPHIEADNSGNCQSYQHIGQHGAADYNYCMKISNAATKEEYQALKTELEGIGYIVEVRLKK